MIIKGQIKSRNVFIDNKQLLPSKSQKVMNHSPDGFSWGYGGSGPAQLALAIMLEKLPEKKAVSLYQDFKWDVVALLPQLDFEIDIDVDSWIKEKIGEPNDSQKHETPDSTGSQG